MERQTTCEVNISGALFFLFSRPPKKKHPIENQREYNVLNISYDVKHAILRAILIFLGQLIAKILAWIVQSLVIINLNQDKWKQTNFDILKVQPKTIDPNTRLLTKKSHKLSSYSPEPCAEVYQFRLNFNILKLVHLALGFCNFVVRFSCLYCLAFCLSLNNLELHKT